jgi:type II secretory pathway pseudopilin PulG
VAKKRKFNFHALCGNEKALSVVELMIALSILLIVLALAFTFYFFGTRAFATGEERSLIQTNVRMTSRMIIQELRYANDVEITTGIPNQENGKRAIFINNSGQLIIRDEQGEERLLSGALSNEITFTDLSFGISPDDNKILVFSVSAEGTKSQEFQLLSDVAPLNLKYAIRDTSNNGDGSAIVYVLDPIQIIAELNVTPRLVFEAANYEQIFELSLNNDRFLNLTVADILLGGVFSELSLNEEINSVDDQTALITLSGNYIEGTGTITVLASALEKAIDLSAEVDIIANLLTIAEDSLPNGIYQSPYDHSLTALGGVSPYVFSLESGLLPAGMNMDINGRIYGTPTIANETKTFMIKVVDSAIPLEARQTYSREYTIEINEQSYDLSMAYSGQGTTIPAIGSHSYPPGSVVDIKANAASGWVFSEWLESIENTISSKNSAETQVTVTGDMVVTAVFTKLFTPLNEIAGGSFLRDSEGNIYIKLTGSNYRTLKYNAGLISGPWNAAQVELMPAKAELENDLWDNARRKEPTSKPYWTKTQPGGNKNDRHYVDNNGEIKTYNIQSSGSDAYLREVFVFPNTTFVDLKDGSYANPHELINIE